MRACASGRGKRGAGDGGAADFWRRGLKVGAEYGIIWGMKTLIPVLMAVAMVAGCCCRVSENEAKVVSPDGKNEIRLMLSGDDLTYEVLRDGVTVVGKSEIGLKVDGAKLLKEGDKMYVNRGTVDGTLETPVYKKASICLKGNVAYADFGDWGVRLVARNDGVAYRFELKKAGQVTIDCEKAEVKIPCARRACG